MKDGIRVPLSQALNLFSDRSLPEIIAVDHSLQVLEKGHPTAHKGSSVPVLLKVKQHEFP